MGAYTCQHGTVHRMCRCPEPHKIACPTPSVCASKGHVPRHRADYVALGVDLTTVTMEHGFTHDDLRECSFWRRERKWVTLLAARDDVDPEWMECLREDHPTRVPTTFKRPPTPRGFVPVSGEPDDPNTRSNL